MSDITNSDFFETILRQAVIQNNKNEISAIPSDEELEKMYTFSERHNQRMKKLFAADRRREVFTVIYKWSKVAIIAVCVSATLTFGVLLTFAEVREAIGDVIVTWFEKFTKFQSTEEREDFTEREWSLEYIPVGFALYDTFETGGITVFEYINPNGIIIEFNYKPSDFSTSTDNEDMDYSIIIENDILYNLFETINERKENKIIWDMDRYRFTVAGNYDINELIKIAISVK